MELRSGRILDKPLCIRTVFKSVEDQKKYVCDVIQNLMAKCEGARGVENKMYYATQVYKIMFAHKDFIASHPSFKKFKVVVVQKANELFNDIKEHVTLGKISAETPIYKESIFYLTPFLVDF